MFIELNSSRGRLRRQKVLTETGIACIPIVLLVFRCAEMRPQWFDVTEVPFHSMWPDDYLWYPYLLNKKYFNAYFKFEGLDKVLNHTITEMDGPIKS